MNKLKKIIFLALFAVLSFGVAKADKYTVNREALPQNAIEFLDQHFAKKKIGMIKVDRHLLKKTDYDVKLVDGTKIEFSNSGKWTSVDCNGKAVPNDIIPKKIRTYVTTNFPDVSIVKIEKKSTGAYEVELSDGVELKFNALLQFTGASMDD